MSVTTSWKKEPHTPGIGTRSNLFTIGDSLWYSSDKHKYDKENKGMTEYSIKSHQIIQTIPYPSDIQPLGHRCVLVKDIIYIIDGYNGAIITFDPKSKSYTKVQSIPKIGFHPSIVSISDTIRIFHGQDNDKYDLTYDTINNTVKIHETKHNKIGAVSTIYHQDRIISIGGWDYTTGKCIDTVSMSQPLTKENVGMINWTIQSQWKLPKGLNESGFVLYRNYILLFGGLSDLGYENIIYLLNINGYNHWQKLEHITCPISGCYVAILTPDNEIHLFLGYNEEEHEGHYLLPLSEIMGKWYPSKFDLDVLKYVDIHTKDIVYGYFRDQSNEFGQRLIPNGVIDICLLYFFD